MKSSCLSNLETRAAAMVSGKTILVTGAAGTIGTALTRRLLNYDPKVIRLLDHNEQGTFSLLSKFPEQERIRPLLGDIRDRERIKRAIQDVDLVFHTAALKHVSLGEYNPFEVVRTNLVALQDLLECCIDANVQKFIFTSSDKAVNPTNVMGGSKFIGERLVTAANSYRGKARAIFASTRFGNVLGSAGSVVPLFTSQIAEGQAVTITHPEMTRFVMSEKESVDLLLAALVTSLGGEVFIPRMRMLKIVDLAEAMVELLGNGKPIKIQEVGLRPGEKLFEELISEEELSRCLETDGLLIVLPFEEESNFEAKGASALRLGPADYPDHAKWATQLLSSKTSTPMSRASVLELLQSELGVLRNPATH